MSIFILSGNCSSLMFSSQHLYKVRKTQLPHILGFETNNFGDILLILAFAYVLSPFLLQKSAKYFFDIQIKGSSKHLKTV